ncbi:MAG: flagellar protein [Butyribacter sp.]|nr:flagellar protein [bacterium]MDY3853616.1 flagellar protein [Butyribacter sp.]
MDVRNCKKCGKLFNFTGESVCPACAKEMEEKFFEVREFIYKNPTANMATVSEEMDIPIQQIKKWVRQERLSFSKDSGISIDCESCGRPILTGRYCKECKTKMANKFSSAYQEKAAKPEKGQSVSSNGKMRFLGN